MQTVNALLASAFKRFGERPALSEPAEGKRMVTLTYRSLQKRAQDFAGYLQQQQLEKGDRLLLWSASRVDIHAEDCALSILPLSHMFEVTIEVALLYLGAHIVYARSLAPETLLTLFSTQHVTCMEDASQAKAAVQQVNKQLASHQQMRGFTLWPEKDFPHTHTLKVKRQDVLAKLPEIRAEAGAK